MTEITVAEVAALVNGELHGRGDVPVTGVATLEAAGPGDLSFVANSRYLAYLHDTRAAAVLVPPAHRQLVPEGLPHVVVADPHIALRAVLMRLYPAPSPAPGIHPTAVVDPTATLGTAVHVGAFAVVEAAARVGDGCSIGAHAFVGEGSVLGAGTVVHAHATVYPGVVTGARCVLHSGARVGKPGFGFVWEAGGHQRVPQIGGCILGDDVEVGCNSTVDRGSVGDTVVGDGTKIDNLVQLGHNVRVGRHVILVSQVGVAGSSEIGDGAVLAGQVGVGGHLSIGPGARLAGQAGVIGDVPAGAEYSGYPARPHREALRAQSVFLRLPELMRRVRRLEQALRGRPGEPTETDVDQAG